MTSPSVYRLPPAATMTPTRPVRPTNHTPELVPEMNPSFDPLGHFLGSFAQVREGRRSADDFLADAEDARHPEVVGDGHAERLVQECARLLPGLPADSAVLLARGLLRHAVVLRRDRPQDALVLIEA